MFIGLAISGIIILFSNQPKKELTKSGPKVTDENGIVIITLPKK
jgi:hypothetical protein